MEKRTYAIGIDPGQTGALAIFQLDGGEYYLNSVFDYADKDLFMPILREISLLENCASVCIEAVHSAPGQGVSSTLTVEQYLPSRLVSSTFKFGANFGWWIGVLDALGYSYTLVSPQKWQGLLFKGFKTPMGSFTASTKIISLEVARSLFNRKYDAIGVFNRKKDHGRSDAALIGWYGILQLH